MSCASCVKKITERLLQHPDITEAAVTLDPPRAKITTQAAFSDASLNDWLKPLGRYRVKPDAAVHSSAAHGPPQGAGQAPGQAQAEPAQSYRPLLIVVGYLLLAVAAATVAHGGFDWRVPMRLFMGGFFVAFSFFKMLDLRGFSDAYRGYDLVAKAVPAYGLAYPFIELVLGLAYLADWQPFWVNAATAVVMAVSLAGVLKAVWSKQRIRCACLGTGFNLPMSTVTIVEDATMLLMALVALALPH